MLRNTSCEQLDLFQYIAYHRIPKNHILLQIDSEISLSFVNDLLADKYNKTFGRPAWNPEVMVRIGILQKLFDLSDEEVIDSIAVDLAFGYFCHLSLMDELPHPSTLCKFRKMRLEDNFLDDIMTELHTFESKNALKTAKYKCMETLRKTANEIYHRQLNA
mgnify:CR=1 FL=1